MMSRARPINADVPVDEPEEKVGSEASEPQPEPEPKPQPAGRRRRRVPGALKLVAALVVVAIGFIVLAIVGGSGGPKEEDGGSGAQAPVLAPPSGEPDAAPDEEPPPELGFPAVATNNTTRVGGADAAANAAAVALAVFPSTTPEQRPAAVTLVGEDDWAGGIAAAVLMAEPVRAPVLVSAPGEAPEVTATALGALAPQGDPSTRGAAAFAIGDVAVPVAGRVTRVPAGPAAAEAAAIARLRDRLFGSPPAHFVVASSAHPEFAMPAAAWAARSGDPVLFTDPGRLPKATARALRRHPDVPVYVLGPSSVVSSDVVRAIGEAGGEVSRVSGEDPVANSVALARYGDGGFGWNINDPGHGFVLARSDSPLDASAAAPLSASGTWGPLLLSDDAATLPAELRDYLLDVKPGYTDNPTRAFYNHVWVIGDQEAIDVNQQAEANELAELAKIGAES
jgi:hypothetical protein